MARCLKMSPEATDRIERQCGVPDVVGPDRRQIDVPGHRVLERQSPARLRSELEMKLDLAAKDGIEDRPTGFRMAHREPHLAR